MDKNEVRRIIQLTLSSGNKTPRLFDLPEIMKIKAKLESSESIHKVLSILEDERTFISNSFGLKESVFDECMLKLHSLKAAT